MADLAEGSKRGEKMADNSYDTGRLNLPFVGICTFGKYPYQPDWDAIDADAFDALLLPGGHAKGMRPYRCK